MHTVSEPLSATPHTQTDNRLSGGWLWLARMGWFYLLLVALGLIAANLPHVTRTTYAVWTIQLARPAVSQVLDFASYVTLMAALKVLVSLACLLAGIIIMVRRSADGMAIYVAALLVSLAPYWGIGQGLDTPVDFAYPTWLRTYAPWVQHHGVMLAWLGLLPFFYFFPNGRFAPRWSGWLVGVVTALGVIVHLGVWLWPHLQSAGLEWSYFLLIGFPTILLGFGVQVYRHRRHLTTSEQQQVKWVLIGVGVWVAHALLGVALIFIPDRTDGWGAVATTLNPVVALGWPITLALAVLRYRLWAVDRVIHRTLVYGLLTLLVVTVYGLGIGLVSALTTRDTAWMISALALFVALGAVAPLRRWVQAVADRLVAVPGRPPPAVARRTSDELVRQSRAFGWAFTLYSAVAIGWLIIGLLPAITNYYPVWREPVRQLAQTLAWSPWLQTAAGNLNAMGWFSRPLSLVIYQYLFSLFNLGMAFTLMRLRPRDWVARLFAIGMVGTAAIFNLQAHGAQAVLHGIGDGLHEGLHPLAGGAYALALVLFPDGTFPKLRRVDQQRARRGIALPLQVLLGVLLVALGGGATLDGEPAGYVFYYGIVAPLLGITAQALRYRQAITADERQLCRSFIGALALALALTLAIGLIAWLLSLSYWRPDFPLRQRLDEITFFVFPLLYTLLPLALTLIVLRYDLWQIDRLINRSLVYGTLTSGVIALYVLIVGVVGVMAQAAGNLLLAVVATGLIAILFQPLRDRLQRTVNRLLYGQLDEPAQVLSQLGDRLAAVASVESAPATLVETVALALKLPYVALLAEPGEESTPLAQQGGRTGEVVTWPVVYQNETVAWLQSSPRRTSESFNPAERALLARIAQQAGPALHALRLTVDLQQSRERLVTAREEERRRLRRDLHDGLGPQLATLSLQIDAARNLLARDPAQAEQVLRSTKAQMQAAIADVRRVVYDLRPPALDQLGLVSALREYATSVSVNGLRLTVNAPESLPALPAAVEVAAYRIALEAITNVVRHARATECVVDLASDQALTLSITDNGMGLPADYRAGVGVLAMRERAAELGGTLVFETGPQSGTKIYLALPLSGGVSLS